ncbi:hypothetical protein M2137_002490 [Parabacteroides sp. PFB2-10]|uniref:hypothetical protein n=1 Tax=Parabacteroides sp. PFB2-10 TaxID=1742405 RepID=UPI002474E749|nr:hypothetical protein [Parabacteroides sp. PFB2-10]MDH6313700.1 hypothetical protein [Parabacteroides sp. PFB2-10]
MNDERELSFTKGMVPAFFIRITVVTYIRRVIAHDPTIRIIAIPRKGYMLKG